jgi:transcriptional regulator with XRE-family HTH domain
LPVDTVKIRILRESAGLTQDQAARLAGIGDRTRWNAIESGRKKSITVATLERIARALKVKPAELLK